MTGRATARVPSRSTAPSARTTTGTTRTTRSGTRSTPRPTPRPELRLVPGVPTTRPRRRPTSALRHKRAPYVLLVVGLLVGTTLALLVLNTVIAVDSLKATQLRAENAERAQEVQRLEQQVVSGSTPAEVARAAVAAGLVPAGPAAYLVIEPDGSVLRGTPEPAPAPGDAEGGD
ncbi:hypothetical protein [Blastococcus sp. CT_GayMR16]|uniref:hypothetical protein n=1 Tax=Blastococcus sp. CT_GayMR16 TaxID=2559607 RepID=UPI001074086A|nr:hypothetical protein [Blastococcus sp. CT_GayMR16]TFV81421.1 hypothetical protein E4P38_22310 [Blastococcus sp. CT_GayMR16]